MVMNKRYVANEMVLAMGRHENFFGGPDPEGFWKWIGVDCWTAYSANWYDRVQDVWLIEQPNHRLDALLSPHWLTLLKAWKAKHEG